MLAKMLRAHRAAAGGRDSPPTATGRGVEVAGRGPWVFHPFLIAAFPVVSLYAHNVREAPPSALARPIGLALLGTAAVWLAFRLATRSAARAGLATSLLVALFFGFGQICRVVDQVCEYLSGFWVEHQTIPPLGVLALLTIAAWAALRVVFRRPGDFRRATAYLNVSAAILVALPSLGAASARMRQPASPLPGLATSKVPAPTSAGPVTGRRPDIYFIVLDGYARSDVMKDLFGFDNGPFLGRLERKGFFVARRSTSNYCQTRLSIASTLNADYLDRLLDPSARADLLPISTLIHDNRVVRLLRPRGYRFVSFATGFEPTDCFDADLFLQPGPAPTEFDRLLVEMTPLGPIFAEVKMQDRYSAGRDRTLFLLDALPKVASMPGPTFTYAHVVCPHPPFLFGEHGEDVSPREIFPHAFNPRLADRKFGTPDYFREAYRKQSIFLTDAVEAMIGRLLAASPEPPIIILQSDHGSWLRYHPDDADATDLRERFGILNAIYLPGRKPDTLDDRMTSVNTFRAVLSDAFGEDLPPLPGRNLFSPFKDPLDFTDVTERLHSDAEKRRQFTYPGKYPSLLQQF